MAASVSVHRAMRSVGDSSSRSVTRCRLVSQSVDPGHQVVGGAGHGGSNLVELVELTGLDGGDFELQVGNLELQCLQVGGERLEGRLRRCPAR